MSTETPSHYTFGDSNLAAARLDHLAAAYAPSSREFLSRVATSPVERAIDLGCGLGHTTSLLAEVTQARYVVGYERSARYLALARARFPTLAFAEVDVLRPPFPDQAVDVVYGRFLLTHLHQPEQAIQHWYDLLRPGGLLILEETSDLAASCPTLQEYYRLVEQMQAHYGQELHIGRRLSRLGEGLRGARVEERQTALRLGASTMARLHAMNIGSWKSDPFMRTTHGTDTLEQLERELSLLADSGRHEPGVRSVMGQVCITRGWP